MDGEDGDLRRQAWMLGTYVPDNKEKALKVAAYLYCLIDKNWDDIPDIGEFVPPKPVKPRKRFGVVKGGVGLTVAVFTFLLSQPYSQHAEATQHMIVQDVVLETPVVKPGQPLHIRYTISKNRLCPGIIYRLVTDSHGTVVWQTRIPARIGKVGTETHAKDIQLPTLPNGKYSYTSIGYYSCGDAVPNMTGIPVMPFEVK